MIILTKAKSVKGNFTGFHFMREREIKKPLAFAKKRWKLLGKTTSHSNGYYKQKDIKTKGKLKEELDSIASHASNKI